MGLNKKKFRKHGAMENCLRSKPKHDVLHGSSPVVGNFTSVGDICPAAPIVDIAGYLIVKQPNCNRP